VYLIYLVEDRKVSWSIFNQTVNALRFLYRVTVQRVDLVPHIPFLRGKKKLPTVLSAERSVACCKLSPIPSTVLP